MCTRSTIEARSTCAFTSIAAHLSKMRISDHEPGRTLPEEKPVHVDQHEQRTRSLPKHAHSSIAAVGGAAASGGHAPCHEREPAETPNASIGKDNYYYLYGKRMRPTNEANELVRSGRYRVSGWNQDGSERLMPVAADKLEWVAWDAIRSRQDRQETGKTAGKTERGWMRS